VLVLDDLKRARGVVKKTAGASLVDLGDGVLCLEFHSKLNILGEDAGQMMRAALEETSRGFGALVIANQGEHFSAGANLPAVLRGRAERRVGRAGRRRAPFPAGQYGAEIRARPGGGRALRDGPGRRLRSGAARRARAGFGRDLHGPGRDRAWA
jgi:hypothetical protein